MGPVKFIHIDYGTKGNAGLYLVQILKAYSGPIPVDAYVHSEFPRTLVQSRVIRLFDHLSRFIPWKFGQLAYKCLDLYICFAWLALVIRMKARKQRLFVFVQFFQSFQAYEWLFRRINQHCTLIVTVHDAVELSYNAPALIMSPRDDIIRHAHFLLVHGSESVEKLSYLSKSILQTPFPLMVAETGSAAPARAADEVVCFLFIGHIRLEKGIDALVNAWRSLPADILKRASLTIAGTCNSDLKIDFAGLNSCRLIFEYLDDDQFVELIKNCHYVVMPYRGGTNSGVLSVATALNRPCITTRIPLFANSPFFEERLSICEPSDLTELLTMVTASNGKNYQTYQERIISRRIAYQADFVMELNRVYDEIIR